MVNKNKKAGKNKKSGKNTSQGPNSPREFNLPLADPLMEGVPKEPKLGSSVSSVSLMGMNIRNESNISRLYVNVFQDTVPPYFLDIARESGDFTKLAYHRVRREFVGFVVCSDEISRVHILALGVVEDCRSLGIGNLLLNHVINTCCSKDVKEIHVLALEQAVGFYERSGFNAKSTIEEHFKDREHPEIDIPNGSYMIKVMQ